MKYLTKVGSECNLPDKQRQILCMNEIPKTIHYCWFGTKNIPESAYRCIDSWKCYLPTYRIKLWNEENFDVNMIPYTRDAYAAGKYAFVSDFARFWILYKEGGLYFDTDVELIRPIDDIIIQGPFMGCERNASEMQMEGRKFICGAANPGLGLGAYPSMEIYSEIIRYYTSKTFIKDNTAQETVVPIVSRILYNHGLGKVEKKVSCAGLHIYPSEFFAPKDLDTRELAITENTRSIHHYDSSWAEWYDKAAGIRGPKLKKVLGSFLGSRINLAIYLYQRHGLTGIVKKLVQKLLKNNND